MSKLLTLLLLFTSVYTNAQDLTGTWQGEFVTGTIGLTQKAKMQLELVELEGNVYGIFRLYPIDTKARDKPNIIYTVQGERKNNNVRFGLYRGKTVESTIPEQQREFFQFTANYKNNDEPLLSGTWYYQL